MAAAMRARRLRSDLDITVIEKTDRISIANCSIPQYLAGRIEDINDLQVLTPQEAQHQHHINVLTNQKVLHIQPAKHHITVENSKTGQSYKIPYHRLILATGADPIYPNWPNINTDGVFALRNLSDAVNVRKFLAQRRPGKIIIVGTGTIAQACASALRTSSAQVKMIGLSDGLMTDLEEPVSTRITDILTDNGIDLYFTDNLYGLEASLDNEITGIYEDSRIHECSCVLLAMGVKPNIEVAKSAGISMGQTGAIRVDNHLMTSKQGIYACGDCTETINRITNRSVYWPLATTAVKQGRSAGESVVNGNGIDPGTYLMRLWTCFNLQIGRVGLSSNQVAETGLKAKTTAIRAKSRPNGSVIDLVLVHDEENNRILGAQAVGTEGIHARINTLATAIAAKMTLKDIETLDLGYTPDISNLWDPVQIAGRIGQRD
jgi:NADPH-dependent 2,4-dienoyl-CoA reductase/sulfur reductase-like enzyme